VSTAAGIRILASPPQAPRANAICERIIGTLRRELFDRLLIVNEHHLRQVLTEYLRHYNAARPHRSLDQLTPVGFQNSATGPDLGFYAARSYSLMRPPRTGRRLIRSWERSAAGWSGRGGWS
jgi:Integrase core domain